jgi:hypothetical protein
VAVHRSGRLKEVAEMVGMAARQLSCKLGRIALQGVQDAHFFWIIQPDCFRFFSG